MFEVNINTVKVCTLLAELVVLHLDIHIVLKYKFEVVTIHRPRIAV